MRPSNSGILRTVLGLGENALLLVCLDHIKEKPTRFLEDLTKRIRPHLHIIPSDRSAYFPLRGPCNVQDPAPQRGSNTFGAVFCGKDFDDNIFDVRDPLRFWFYDEYILFVRTTPILDVSQKRKLYGWWVVLCRIERPPQNNANLLKPFEN